MQTHTLTAPRKTIPSFAALLANQVVILKYSIICFVVQLSLLLSVTSVCWWFNGFLSSNVASRELYHCQWIGHNKCHWQQVSDSQHRSQAVFVLNECNNARLLDSHELSAHLCFWRVCMYQWYFCSENNFYFNFILFAKSSFCSDSVFVL